MRYVTTIGEETLDLELVLEPDGSYVVRGSGGPDVAVSILARDAGQVSLLVAGQTFQVEPASSEVRHRKERYTVRAQSVLEHAAAQLSEGVGAPSRCILASMPGRIVRVLCEVGAIADAGSPLIVMEAMKMQNELCAKSSGVVRSIHVEVGQNVERGALLVELE